jgi:hypothetical protein
MKASYKLTGVYKVNLCQKKADPEKLRKSQFRKNEKFKTKKYTSMAIYNIVYNKLKQYQI